MKRGFAEKMLTDVYTCKYRHTYELNLDLNSWIGFIIVISFPDMASFYLVWYVVYITSICSHYITGIIFKSDGFNICALKKKNQEKKTHSIVSEYQHN